MTDVMKTILDSCGEIQISPKGRSMLPYLAENRDKVRVVPVKDKLEKYDVVLYKSGGFYILHRAIAFDGEFYFICGDNSTEVERVKRENIIGVVSEIIRKNNSVEMKNDFRYRVWIKLWYEWKLKKLYMKLKKIFRNNKKNT